MKIYDNETISKKINKKNKKSKIIRAIVNPIIIILFLICIIVFLKKILYPNKNPSIFGYQAFIIASGSMEPKLNIGDMVVIKKVKKEQIKKGDIITFLEEGKENTVTHRINDIINQDGETKYQTKGDNNNAIDSYLVPYENIQGVYKFKIGKIGIAILNSQNIVAIIFIITFFYILLVIGERKDDKKIVRHEKREEYEKEQKK